MAKKPKTATPICKRMCGTCPFRKGSPYEHLKPALSQSALTEASRECHSTGSNGVNYRTGKKPKLCRGARDLQLHVFFRLGMIKAPTDAAWAERCRELGLPVPIVC